MYNDYKDLVNEIIVGEIYQLKPNFILLIHNGNEIIFPKSEQIPKERYKKGESIRVYIKSVEKRPSGPPLIVVSRACDEFLKKLFELEIPEIYDNIIEIKGIAREPGERAKVAVYSYDDRIDAVGACVGMKGIRIHSIVRELCNENIDVINFTEDIGLYIARALAPAKLKDIYLDKDAKVAKIVADEDQVSLIIGKNGQNIKLASKLTGYEIDVERKDQPAKEDEEEETNDEDEEVKDEEKKDEEVKDEEVKDEEETEGDKNADEETEEEEDVKKEETGKGVAPDETPEEPEDKEEATEDAGKENNTVEK